MTMGWRDFFKICDWASKHKELKISTLFESKAMRRKLIRHKNNMVVPKQGLLAAISEAVRFIWKFIKHPSIIGAILPSSNFLAEEIIQEIPKDLKAGNRLILEVGPGTGVFTDKIIKRMNPSDELHLVEYDSKFCEQLREKYKDVPNVKIFECLIEDFESDANKKYDFIISGLPLNAFKIDIVEKVLKKFEEISNPNAKLSYFEYLVLPDIKKLFSNAAERTNMNAILESKEAFYQKHAFKKVKVFLNAPPAKVVHHCINKAELPKSE